MPDGATAQRPVNTKLLTIKVVTICRDCRFRDERPNYSVLPLVWKPLLPRALWPA